MTAVTRREVLGLYRKIFRIAKKWQSASGQVEQTTAEREYIIKEAKTLFRKNKDVTDLKLIKQCIEECEARIEIGLHYNIPYPRPGLSEEKLLPVVPSASGTNDTGCAFSYGIYDDDSKAAVFQDTADAARSICLPWVLPRNKAVCFDIRKS